MYGAAQPLRNFQEQMHNKINDQFEKYPKLKEILDSGKIQVVDNEHLRTIQQELFPQLENKKIKLSRRQYWLVFRMISQKKAYWLVDPLLSYYKRDYGIPTDLIYDKLFELEGKRDLQKLLDVVQEAKQNKVQFSLGLHTTILKGIAARGTEQMIKDSMNEIKQLYPTLDVLVYAVYLEGLAKYSTMEALLEGLREMQQHNITPNSIVLNGILKRLVYKHKGHSILDSFKTLIKEVAPNARSFETILKHASVIQDVNYFNNVWDMVPQYKHSHTPAMFNSRVYLYSRSGDITNMMKAFTEMQQVGITANRLTFAFLLEGHIQANDVNGVLNLLSKFGVPTQQASQSIVHFLESKGQHELAKQVASSTKPIGSHRWMGEISNPVTEDHELIQDLTSLREESTVMENVIAK